MSHSLSRFWNLEHLLMECACENIHESYVHLLEGEKKPTARTLAISRQIPRKTYVARKIIKMENN